MAEEKTIVLKIETITDQAVMEAYGKTLNDVLGSYEDNVALISQYNAQIKANNEQIKAITAAAEAYGKTTKNQSEALERLTAENGKLTAAKAQLVQVTKNQEKIDTTVKGTMENQAQLLGKLRMAWRKMTDEQKEANQGMLETIQALDEGLKQSDASIGNFQRNVGNYAGAIRPLQTQVQMLVREMPTLTMSMNTFIMAISNNLPMFADEVKRLKNANAQLAQQGKPTINIMQAIVASLFSWQTALVAGIALLPSIISGIDEFINGTGEADENLQTYTKRLQSYQEQMALFQTQFDSSHIETSNRGLKTLISTVKDLGKSYLDLVEAEDAYRSTKRSNELSYIDRQISQQKRLLEVYEEEYRLFDAIPANRGKKSVELDTKIAEAEKTINELEQRELEIRQESYDVVLKTEEARYLYKKSAQEKELYELDQQFKEELLAYQRAGRSTTELYGFYYARKKDIREKYRKIEEEERKKDAEAQRKASQKEAAERAKEAAKIEKDITNAIKRELEDRKDLVAEGRDAIRDGMRASVDEAQDFFTEELEQMSEEIANDPALNKVAESAFARAIGVSDEELAEIKQQAQKAAQDIFNSIAKISQDATKRRLDDELDAIEREADSEKAILEGKLEKGVILQTDYEKKLAELDEETAARKEEANKEAFEKNKAWNIAQALMNAALAISKVFATTGPPASFVMAGITAATTAAQIATIATQKYARGGMLSGPSHAQGGIPGFVGNRHIEAEGGEAIINKRSTAKHRKLLSLINSDNGWGVDFANARGSSGRMFARGGVLGYDFSTAPLPDTRGSLAAFAKQQTANINSALSAINKRIDNIRVYLPLSDIEQRSDEKRVNVSRANL